MEQVEAGPKEKFYDEHISPLVNRIIDRCKENDIARDLVCELDDGMTAITSAPSSEDSAGQRMRFYLAKAGNNFDAFAIAVAKDKKITKGHSSLVLAMMGIEPEAQ
jgi:hypothetical protein